MLQITDVNERRPRCKRCGCLANLVWVDDPAERRELLAVLRQGKTVSFINLLRSKTGCELSEGKATAQHIAGEGGVCHRCGTSLGGAGIWDCSKCSSTNLIWEEPT